MTIDAHTLPQAIQWHEGMLLSPQHFQQLSLRQEELLHYHLMTAAPFHWGVKRLKIDQGLLIDGIFRITELEAVMPDGLIVWHRPDAENSLETDMSPYHEEMKQGPVTVHLAVPAKRPDMASVKGVLPRFASVEGDAVPDENTGESEVMIPRLIPRLSLPVTDHPPRKYVSFPIAKVGYRDETVSLTDYVPPVLSVSPDSPIGGMCASAARRVREKAVFLSERLGSSDAMVKGSMTLETQLLIRSLVSGLPGFEAVLATGISHPYPLYLAFCSLAGSLSSLGAGMIPPVLPAYNHNNLRVSFEQVLKFVFRIIAEGVIESHAAIPFEFRSGVFSLKLRPAWMGRRLIIGMKAKSGVPEKDIVSWADECLIGSETHIESMKDRRILGARRTKIERDEELVPAKGVVLFSVTAEPADNEYRFVEAEEELKIFNNVDLKGTRCPAEIMLYVRNQDQG